MRQTSWVELFIEKTRPQLKQVFENEMEWDPSPLITERLTRLRELETQAASQTEPAVKSHSVEDHYNLTRLSNGAHSVG